MTVLAPVLAALAVAAFLVLRWRAGLRAETGVADGGRDVGAAARRLGFRPEPGRDPVEAVTDPRLAAAAVVAAVAALDGPLGRDEVDMMVVEAQLAFGVGQREAEDLVLVGRWLAGRAGGGLEAVRRLAPVVARRAGHAAAPDLLRMAEAAATHAGPLDAAGETAVDLIRRAFAVKV